MVPKGGNKGGNEEHHSQVAPRVPQEPQNEPKLVPKVSNLRSKRCRKPSKIQTKGVTSCSYPCLCLALARSPKFSQMPHRCCPNSHFSAFTCFDSVGNFPACFFSGWSKRSEAERGSSYLSAFTCFDSLPVSLHAFSGGGERSEAERGRSYLSAFTCFDSVPAALACFFRCERAN